jgi:hypothetical protein
MAESFLKDTAFILACTLRELDNSRHPQGIVALLLEVSVRINLRNLDSSIAIILQSLMGFILKFLAFWFMVTIE